MYIIETYGFDGAVNMAYDVALGEIVDDVVLRFYTWKTPTLSLGRHQKTDDLDLEYIVAKNFDLVRRPSGGRAVLHWDEITYSVVVPKNQELFNTTVLELYNLLSELLVRGLRKAGYPVEMVEGRKKIASHVCFQTPSAYEIALNGIKVVGSAQTRTQDYILQHGSIILIPHDEIKYCFRSTKNLNIPLIGLYDYKYVPFDDIVSGIRESFGDFFGQTKRFINQNVLFEKINDNLHKFRVDINERI